MTVANDQPAAAMSRLERLEGYLQQDPENPALLAEACEAALAAGDPARALVHVATAERLALEPRAWTFRRATACIAGRNLDQAETLLRNLLADGNDPVLSHDLGYVWLLRGRFEDAWQIAQPWLARTELPPRQLEALQVLWLRAGHALNHLEASMAWLEGEAARGRLQVRAQGPAALIAVDSSRFDLALAWSDAALAVEPRQKEALLARAYVAMAQRQPEGAVRLLENALRQNPGEGRLWSALGYANLQLQNLPQARMQLARAAQALPAHVGTWHALGWVCLLQQDHAAARAAFQEALDRDRNFAESHGAYALMLAIAGDKAAAEHHLRLAQRLDATNVTGRYVRAALAGELKDRGRLIKLASHLLDRPGFFGGTLSDALEDGAPGT